MGASLRWRSCWRLGVGRSVSPLSLFYLFMVFYLLHWGVDGSGCYARQHFPVNKRKEKKKRLTKMITGRSRNRRSQSSEHERAAHPHRFRRHRLLNYLNLSIYLFYLSTCRQSRAPVFSYRMWTFISVSLVPPPSFLFLRPALAKIKFESKKGQGGRDCE